MSPPSWAIESGTRLTLNEFDAAFASAWSRIESRFLKLECWQAYQELETNESQAAYKSGDVATARELLRREAEVDGPLYEDVQRRGIEYARVRLIQEPLTPYLEYELLSYRIRAEMGENIEIVRSEPELGLPDKQYFDFLLFDQHTALIHDYGTGEVGRQTGGWITHEQAVIDGLTTIVARLRERAMPLQRYFAQA